MSNIMSMIKLRNKVSRNGFDLSRKNLFTAKVGEMLPVACIECIPGDSFDIDMAWFTRTTPVNTAAYTRIREYYDWYFVPTNLLWNKFNTFVTQMSDNNQKATGINGNVKLSDEHPYFTTSQIVTYLNNLKVTNYRHNFFNLDRVDLTCKLLHYLDYGDFRPYAFESAENWYTDAKLNPFPLLAYQKIYQDYVRDSQWERAYAPSCNIDYISGAAGTLNLPISEIDYEKHGMFDLRYFNWNKDYFMGLLPNSQYGSASIVDAIGDLYDTPSGEYPGNGAFVQSGYQYTGDSSKFFLNTQGNMSSDERLRLYSKFTILSLRQAEAKQKWSEITQSQQQDYKAQIQAHYDVTVSEAYSDRCTYIGGVNGNVDIEAVTNQNLTGSNDANIAGRGQGGARGSIKYDSKVHGYLMCIYHAAPLLDYSIDGIKRQNLKTSVYDYAIPEFDSTGMVNVPLIELTGSTNGFFDTSNPEDYLLGYAPRYVDYKTSYDLVHGAFYNGGLDHWVAPVSKHYISEYLNNLGAAISSGVVNYHFMKIPPSVLNPIFGTSVDNFTSSDQLLINCSFDIKAVRNLDRNGLPY